MKEIFLIIAVIFGIWFYFEVILSQCDYSKPITEIPAFCSRTITK